MEAVKQKHRCAVFASIMEQLSLPGHDVLGWRYTDKRYLSRKLNDHLARCVECSA